MCSPEITVNQGDVFPGDNPSIKAMCSPEITVNQGNVFPVDNLSIRAVSLKRTTDGDRKKETKNHSPSLGRTFDTKK